MSAEPLWRLGFEIRSAWPTFARAVHGFDGLDGRMDGGGGATVGSATR